MKEEKTFRDLLREYKQLNRLAGQQIILGEEDKNLFRDIEIISEKLIREYETSPNYFPTPR